MPRENKIVTMGLENKVSEMISQGKSNREIAKEIGVSEACVRRYLDSVPKKTTHIVARDEKKVEKIVDSQINVLDQLSDINQRVKQTLDKVQKDPAMLYKACAEIRAQLELQVKLYQLLYDAQAMQDFIEEVVRIVEEVDRDAARRLLQRFKEKRSVRAALGNYRREA